MRYPINWQDEREIKRLFSWQARVGLAPKFGSRPIGWYQRHQTAVYDIIVGRLDATKTDPKEVFKKGYQIVTDSGVIVGRIIDIYRKADEYTRSN